MVAGKNIIIFFIMINKGDDEGSEESFIKLL